MKPNAIVILELSYYQLKKDYINSNYNVTDYFSPYPECDKWSIGENKVKHIVKLQECNVDKVIIAMPISPVISSITNVLINQLLIPTDDIVLLIKAPNYLGMEHFNAMRRDIEYSVHKNGKIVVSVDDCKFFIISENELFIMGEVFCNKCYDFYLPDRNITFIDIGMNVGIASLYFAKSKNASKVYSFEPFAATYNCAIEHFEMNGVTEIIKPHLFGLGKTTHTLDLEYNENLKGHMSTVRDNRLSGGSTKKVSIDVVDATEALEPIFEEHRGSTFVMKIDCEGSEYDIFDRLSETGLLKNFKFITMEWHNFGGNNISQLEDIFQQNNFFYHVLGPRYLATGMMIAVNIAS